MSYHSEKALWTVILTIVTFMGFATYSSEVRGEVEQPIVVEDRAPIGEIVEETIPLEATTLFRLQRKIINEINLSEKEVEVVYRERPHDTSCEPYRNVIEEYPWPIDIAMKVCAAESLGIVDNINDEYHEDGMCYNSVGLFQIACVHGFTDEEMSNPYKNVAYAYSLWVKRGWSPWGVCHDGKVDCGL